MGVRNAGETFMAVINHDVRIADGNSLIVPDGTVTKTALRSASMNVNDGLIFGGASSSAVTQWVTAGASRAQLLHTGMFVAGQMQVNGTIFAVGSMRWANVVSYSSGPQTLATSHFLVSCDTTGGAFTVNFPAAPVDGQVVFFLDSDSNFGTANLTVGRNGKLINGAAADYVIAVDGGQGFIYDSGGGEWFTIGVE